MTLHFKIKTGFAPMEFISIGEDEVAMGQRAMVTGKVAVFRNGTIAGNHIHAIVPDWHKELNYNPEYELKGQDMQEIPSVVQDEYRTFLENTNEEVKVQLGGRTDNLKLT